MDSTATYKKRHAGFTCPSFGTQHNFESDPQDSAMHVDIPLPAFRDQQILAAQDPLASAHNLH
eukprot:1131032-Karenia_brevis.AAC.1